MEKKEDNTIKEIWEEGSRVEILKLEIKKLELEIELEKLKHKEYWQPIITVCDRVPSPLETFS